MSDLIEIAANLSSYLTSASPQVKEGALQWYLAGSLATSTMASAESMTEIKLDKENNLIGETDQKVITQAQRAKISKFSRKLGFDIDVVNVNGNMLFGVPKQNRPHMQNIIQQVPNVLELMSWKPETGRFSTYR